MGDFSAFERPSIHASRNIGISSHWPETDNSPFQSVGLENDVNDCYMNALIQAILHHPMVAQWLKNHHHELYQPQRCRIQESAKFALDNAPLSDVTKTQKETQHRRDDCLPCLLRGVLENYWSEKPNQKAMNEKKKKLYRVIKTSKQWKNNTKDEQEDAHLSFIDMVEIFMDNFRFPGPADNNLFKLNFLTQGSCYSHGHWNLELDCSGLPTLPLGLGSEGVGDVPLVDLIRGQLEETIDDVSCIVGRACGARKRYVQLNIARAPELLCIQLKIFQPVWRGKKIKFRKINKRVAFEESLDLSKYYMGTKPLLYKLYAVVEHGGELSNGHYVCFAKDQSNTWARIDDNVITREPKYLERNRKRDNLYPYMLFYTRVKIEESCKNPSEGNSRLENQREKKSGTTVKPVERVSERVGNKRQRGMEISSKAQPPNKSRNLSSQGQGRGKK